MHSARCIGSLGLNFDDDHGAAAREVAAICTWQSITYLLAGYFFVLFALTVVAIFVTGWASLAAVAKIERQSGGTNSGGSITQTLTNKNGGGVTLDKTVTTTSADGKSITIQRDANGDNLNDQTESRVTAADGSTTITVSDLNPDGSLKDQTTSVTTANGLTRMTQSDLDGNSTTDVTVTDATVVNADASRTQTVSQTSNNGMLANKTVTQHSADGSTKSVKTDVNGDGTFDLTQAFVIAFAADRSSTTTEIDPTPMARFEANRWSTSLSVLAKPQGSKASSRWRFKAWSTSLTSF